MGPAPHPYLHRFLGELPREGGRNLWTPPLCVFVSDLGVWGDGMKVPDGRAGCQDRSSGFLEALILLGPCIPAPNNAQISVS